MAAPCCRLQRRGTEASGRPQPQVWSRRRPQRCPRRPRRGLSPVAASAPGLRARRKAVAPGSCRPSVVLQPRNSSALGLQVSGGHDGCGRGRRSRCRGPPPRVRCPKRPRGWPRGCRPVNRRRAPSRQGSSCLPPGSCRCEIEFASRADEPPLPPRSVLASDPDRAGRSGPPATSAAIVEDSRSRMLSLSCATSEGTGSSSVGMASRASITTRPRKDRDAQVAVAENGRGRAVRPRTRSAATSRPGSGV